MRPAFGILAGHRGTLLHAFLWHSTLTAWQVPDPCLVLKFPCCPNTKQLFFRHNFHGRYFCQIFIPMTSTGVEVPGSAMADYIIHEKDQTHDSFPKEKHEEDQIQSHDSSSIIYMQRNNDSTHRQLRPRHIQLIGIARTIGTALHVQIGHGLLNGGPASLFLASTIWYVWLNH